MVLVLEIKDFSTQQTICEGELTEKGVKDMIKEAICLIKRLERLEVKDQKHLYISYAYK